MNDLFDERVCSDTVVKRSRARTVARGPGDMADSLTHHWATPPCFVQQTSFKKDQGGLMTQEQRGLMISGTHDVGQVG